MQAGWQAWAENGQAMGSEWVNVSHFLVGLHLPVPGEGVLRVLRAHPGIEGSVQQSRRRPV